MTKKEKLKRLNTLLAEEVDCDTASEYLDIASETLLNRLYPFGIPSDREVTVPVRYEGLQCELAARAYARRGGLGEKAHSENGISRTWDTANDEDLLSRIVPFARVV